MNEREALARLDRLIVKYLRVPKNHQLDDDDEVADFAADWRIVDLGMMVEAEFGIPMSADKALSLKTVGDWRVLLSTESGDKGQK